MKIKKIYPCVIGLGYVGLPLFLQIQKKFETIGFDVNKQRIKQLNNKFDVNNEYKRSGSVRIFKYEYLKAGLVSKRMGCIRDDATDILLNISSLLGFEYFLDLREYKYDK